MIQENGVIAGYGQAYKQRLLEQQRIDHNPTVEDNIDEKIRYYESEIARLKQSKEDLAPLLKMRIRDIRQAMDY